jgi:hypothetical protein
MEASSNLDAVSSNLVRAQLAIARARALSHELTNIIVSSESSLVSAAQSAVGGPVEPLRPSSSGVNDPLRDLGASSRAEDRPVSPAPSPLPRFAAG